MASRDLSEDCCFVDTGGESFNGQRSCPYDVSHPAPDLCSTLSVRGYMRTHPHTQSSYYPHDNAITYNPLT